MDKMIKFSDSILQATHQAMERNPDVFVYGLGVDDQGGMYGTTKDLHKIFGSKRCFDTPISEDSMTGMGIGAALAGLRPIHVHQRMDFLLLCLNQIINIAAKYKYMFGGQFNVPYVVRCVVGRSWGQGAQHSQSFHSMLMNIPGVLVVAPTTPYDAKGLLAKALEINDPVIFVEHRMLYGIEGLVPDEYYTLEFGKARVLSTGYDITLVGVSHMIVECLRAKNILLNLGITVEVIDPVTITPLDVETIRSSLEKTKHLLVVDNGWLKASFASELIASLVVDNTELLGCTYDRLGFADVPCPTTRNLEMLFYPDSKKIVSKVLDILGVPDKCISGYEWEIASELKEFKGPF